MTFEELKSYISDFVSHVTFEYNGYSCGIDPLSQNNFEMWMGNKNITMHSIEEVFSVEFFDGKSLFEIWGNVVNVEY